MSAATCPSAPLVSCAAPGERAEPLPPRPGIPVFSPGHGNGLAVSPGTPVTISSAHATTIRYTMNNSEPTCAAGVLYADASKPVITTTNTTIKAIGCNEAGGSDAAQRRYFTSPPRSSLFDYDAVRAGVGHDGGNFPTTLYQSPTPANYQTYVRNKTEFETAIAAAKDRQLIVVESGTYDLGLQDIYRSTSGAPVTIRAIRPMICDLGPGTGVTLTGSTKLRFLTDNWKLEGFCFENISNDTAGDGYSSAIQVRASDFTLSQNTFKNLGSASNWFIAVVEGGGTNLAGERRHLQRNVFTRNRFSNIVGIGIAPTQPSPAYAGRYTWPLETQITHNTFEDSPLVLRNGGEAIHVGLAGDDSESFDDYQGIRIANNLFTDWDGDGELIGIKSTGNSIEDNLIVNSVGGISIRAGHRNTVRRNYVINSEPSCNATRVSGTGNVFESNIFDLSPDCIVWYWTAKQLTTAPSPGFTVSTLPAVNNHFRRNKVKNARWVAWVLRPGSTERWFGGSAAGSDLPRGNELRLNEFYDMTGSLLFHSDIPASIVIPERIRSLNTIGDNVFVDSSD